MTDDQQRQSQAFVAIARNLRDFGYPDVDAKMIAETYQAMQAGTELPHGIVGMFAKRQIEELQEAGRL